MRTRPAICTLLAVVFIAATASPALACKGAENLVSGFSGPWVKTTEKGTFEVKEDKATGSSEEMYFGTLGYEGAFFPAADACVDITMPQTKHTVIAGMKLTAETNSYYVEMANDGQVRMEVATPDGWLNPVPAKKYDAVKTNGEPNTLEIVWGQDNTKAHVSVNDQALFDFDFPQRGRKMGVFVVTPGGDSVEFTKLAVTK